MLTGSGEYIIDSKKRMALPKEMRAELGEYVFLSPGFESGSLTIFPPEMLQELQAMIRTKPLSETVALRRNIFSRTKRVQIDGQGRVLIPQELLAQVGLEPEDKVKVVGSGDYAEIWPLDLYNTLYGEGTTDLLNAFHEAGL